MFSLINLLFFLIICIKLFAILFTHPITIISLFNILYFFMSTRTPILLLPTVSTMFTLLTISFILPTPFDSIRTSSTFKIFSSSNNSTSTSFLYKNLGPDNQLSLYYFKQNIRVGISAGLCNPATFLQYFHSTSFLITTTQFSTQGFKVFHFPLIQYKATSESVQQLTLLITTRFSITRFTSPTNVQQQTTQQF